MAKDHIALAIKRAYVSSRRVAQGSGKFNPAKKYEYAWEKAAADVRRLKADVQQYVQAQFAKHRPFPNPDHMFGPDAITNYNKYMQEFHKDPLQEALRLVESEFRRFKSRLQFGDPVEQILESVANDFSPVFRYFMRRTHGLETDIDLRERVALEFELSPAKLEVYKDLLPEGDVVVLEATKRKG